MLYNAVLVSAVQQSESTVCPHTCLLFRFPSHLGFRWEELPVLCSRFSFLSAHTSVYMSIPISQFILSCFPSLTSLYLLLTSVSLLLLCKHIHLYHFSRFHLYVLICICFSISEENMFIFWKPLKKDTSG